MCDLASQARPLPRTLGNESDDPGHIPGNAPALAAASRHSEYYQAVQAEDAKLAATLAAIRADVQAGDMDVLAAAENRIGALEAHMQTCGLLRAAYLGDDPIPQPGHTDYRVPSDWGC